MVKKLEVAERTRLFASGDITRSAFFLMYAFQVLNRSCRHGSTFWQTHQKSFGEVDIGGVNLRIGEPENFRASNGMAKERHERTEERIFKGHPGVPEEVGACS